MRLQKDLKLFVKKWVLMSILQLTFTEPLLMRLTPLAYVST